MPRRSTVTTSRTRARAATHSNPQPQKAKSFRVQPQLDLNDGFKQALRAISDRKPLIFITGGAGTGKSTLVRYICQEFRDRKIAVVAPTGIAALNAGGQTIHSFFNFPPKPLAAEDIEEHQKPDLLKSLQLLIIDEVSMVRADVMDAIDRSLRITRRSSIPFGGVQVVMVGDLYQLPPVVKFGERGFFCEHYPSEFFFDASAVRTSTITAIELEQVYRQTDQKFVQLLADIRQATQLDSSIKILNDSCVGRKLTGSHLVLVPTVSAAQRLNDEQIASLPGQAHEFPAHVEGRFEKSSDRLPAPLNLVVKPGLQVMFTKNDSEKRWVNGTIGIVKTVSRDRVHVNVSGSIHQVEREEWKNTRYEYDRRTDTIQSISIGTYRQFPLMPARAVTIHKAQGLTLDQVEIDFDRGAFADGQAYVALSRCRSLNALSLARPLRVDEVRTSSTIQHFYRRLWDTPATAKTLTVANWHIDPRPQRVAEVINRLLRFRVDVAVLTDFNPNDSFRRRLSDAGYCHLSVSERLTIASRLPLRPSQIRQSLSDHEDTFLPVEVEGLNIIAAAFPKAEAKVAPWQALLHVARTHNMTRTIVVGDLKTGAPRLDEESAIMVCGELFEELSLVGWRDLWRRQHGNTAREFTWVSPKKKQFRLAHAFASPSMAAKTLCCFYDHEVRTTGLTPGSLQIVETRL